MFLGTFLIALREGVEASLIVGILIGLINKMGRKDLLWKVWLAVALAAAIPLALGAYFTWGPYTLMFQTQEIIGGVLSLLAAVFVSWMIFWMTSHSHNLAASIKQDAKDAIENNSTRGLITLAVLTVGREGIETAIFIWATLQSGVNTGALEPILGVICGLIFAIIVGSLVYFGVRVIPLAQFFKITTFLLIFVAAGIVVYGIGDLQEAGILPGFGIYLFDLSSYIANSASSVWFVLLNAFFNIQYLFSPTHLQFVGWVIYLAAALSLFVVGIRNKKGN